MFVSQTGPHAKAKGSATGRSLSNSPPIEAPLLDRGGDVAERGAELAAEALHDRDNRDRDAGGDQAVFNSRRARLVLGKAFDGLHGVAPWSTRGCLSTVRPGLLSARCDSARR